jgi:uncharacterized protein YggU (UPF0235/DUF167 family)
MPSRDIDARPGPTGSRLKVRAHAGARRNRIEPGPEGAVKISVTAVPERGRANAAIERLLAEALDVPPSSVRVAVGASARDKIVEIDGLAPDELARRLGRALGAG